MEHLDLKLLSIISLILGFVYHMIAFLNLQKKLSDAESENYELSEFFRLTHEGNQYLQ